METDKEPDALHEERLPWLQVVDEEEARGHRGGRAAGFAIGGIALVAAVAGLIYAGSGRSVQEAPSNAAAANVAAASPAAEEPGDGANSVFAAPPGRASVRTGKPDKMASAAAPASGAKAGSHDVLAGVPKRVSGARPPTAPAVPARHSGAVAQPAGSGKPAAHARAGAAPPSVARAAGPGRAKPKAAENHGAQGVPFKRGATLVQLGAYDSRAAAEAVWLRASATGRLHGAPHRVERAVVHGRVFYRLRVQPRSGGCGSISTRRCFEVRRH